MFSKAYQIIIAGLVALLLILAISYKIQGTKLKHAQDALAASELQTKLAIADHRTCKGVVENNNKAYAQLKKDYAAIKAKGPEYIIRYKKIYKDLNEGDQNVLNAQLPEPVIRVLENSSKN